MNTVLIEREKAKHVAKAFEAMDSIRALGCDIPSISKKACLHLEIAEALEIALTTQADSKERERMLESFKRIAALADMARHSDRDEMKSSLDEILRRANAWRR